MTNAAEAYGFYLMMAVPAAANAGVGPISGDPLMFGDSEQLGGNMCGVASASYTPPNGYGTPNPQGVSVFFIGVYFLSVVALDGLSPATGEAIKPGDRIFASGGTYDATTGCTYGFTLDANDASGVYFGNAIDAVPAGQTSTIRVRLKVTG